MWAYLFSVPRTEGATDEVERTHISVAYTTTPTNGQPGGVPPLFVHLGKKRAWVLVKADLNDDQASILSDNDRLLTGTVKLIWWEPVMGEDFRRTLDENDKEGSDIKVCKIDLKGPLKGKEAELLEMMVESLPDGPDKDCLLEALVRKKSAAERALSELEELAMLLKSDRSVCVDGSNERALAFLTEKVESLPDGPNKDRLRAALARGPKETQH